MKRTHSKRTEAMNIRLEKDLKEKLQKIASKENRTLSNFVYTLFLDLVNKSEKK